MVKQNMCKSTTYFLLERTLPMLRKHHPIHKTFLSLGLHLERRSMQEITKCCYISSIKLDIPVIKRGNKQAPLFHQEVISFVTQSVLLRIPITGVIPLTLKEGVIGGTQFSCVYTGTSIYMETSQATPPRCYQAARVVQQLTQKVRYFCGQISRQELIVYNEGETLKVRIVQ